VCIATLSVPEIAARNSAHGTSGIVDRVGRGTRMFYIKAADAGVGAIVRRSVLRQGLLRAAVGQAWGSHGRKNAAPTASSTDLSPGIIWSSRSGRTTSTIWVTQSFILAPFATGKIQAGTRLSQQGCTPLVTRTRNLAWIRCLTAPAWVCLCIDDQAAGPLDRHQSAREGYRQVDCQMLVSRNSPASGCFFTG
jgi:hypothetical protein